MMAQDTTVHVHGLVVEPWQVAVMLIGLALIQCGVFLWGVHVGREVATEPEVLPDVADLDGPCGDCGGDGKCWCCWGDGSHDERPCDVCHGSGACACVRTGGWTPDMDVERAAEQGRLARAYQRSDT